MNCPEESSEAAPATAALPQRILAFDVVRGIFMVLIIAGHALTNLAPDAVPRQVRLLLRFVFAGTVGFTTISGILVGYLAMTRADNFGRIRVRYRIQGLRLLFVAHPLINLALIGPTGQGDSPWHYVLRTIYITDVLAVLFLGLVPFADRLRSSTALGAGIFLVAVTPFLSPVLDRAELVLLRDILCDTHAEERVLFGTYALLPLTGFFLVGICIGKRIARATQEQGLETLGRQFRSDGVLLVCGSLVLLGLWALSRLEMWGTAAQPFRSALYPNYYLSLYPGYLGTTLILISALIARRHSGLVESFFAVFGRTSLFIYVVQYYVVQTLPWAIGWKGSLDLVMFSVFLAASVAVLFLVAVCWDHVKRARAQNSGVC